ncbi:MAG: hypothetical protein C7B44_03200 [Sulfobacillus thermosulfidooxidans]|nr:MAG: hypothetical protein C7B44_03200 [Sulfobacillus thermosulfidooxidans]
MDSLALLSAGMLGLAVYAWHARRVFRVIFPLSLALLWVRPHVLTLSVLLAAAGFEVFLTSRRMRAGRDLAEQETEVFLQRLSRTLRNRGSLSQALDDVARSDSRIVPHPDPHRVLMELRERWHTEAMLIVSLAAGLSSRYGGSLAPIIDNVIQHMGRARRQRFGRRLEETALESTVMVLAVVPYGLLLIFRMALPSFYNILTQTTAGHMVIGMLGMSTAGVLMGLSWYIRKEESS